jgi:hypothetical protein
VPTAHGNVRGGRRPPRKLFLDEPDYVVPPTVGRIVPRSAYPEEGRGVRATFPGGEAVLVVL